MLSRVLGLLACHILLSAGSAAAQANVAVAQHGEGKVLTGFAPRAFTTKADFVAPGEQQGHRAVFGNYSSNDYADQIQNALGIRNGQMDFYAVHLEESRSTFTAGVNADGLVLRLAW